MNPRENLIALYRRRGYERAPVCFNFCPDLVREFEVRLKQRRLYKK